MPKRNPLPCDHHSYFALTPERNYRCQSCGQIVNDLAYARLRKEKVCPICHQQFIAYHGKVRYCPLCRQCYPRWYQKVKVLGLRGLSGKMTLKIDRGEV